MQTVFEKIIEKLEELHERYINQYGAVGGNPMAFSVKECMEIVQEVAEEYNNGWIPCSERLPEERINPVTHDYYQYPVMFESDGVEDIKYYYFGNGHWRYGLQIMDCYVTHWMDIKPYQPKGE